MEGSCVKLQRQNETTRKIYIGVQEIQFQVIWTRDNYTIKGAHILLASSGFHGTECKFDPDFSQIWNWKRMHIYIQNWVLVFFIRISLSLVPLFWKHPSAFIITRKFRPNNDMNYRPSWRLQHEEFKICHEKIIINFTLLAKQFLISSNSVLGGIINNARCFMFHDHALIKSIFGISWPWFFGLKWLFQQ